MANRPSAYLVARIKQPVDSWRTDADTSGRRGSLKLVHCGEAGDALGPSTFRCRDKAVLNKRRRAGQKYVWAYSAQTRAIDYWDKYLATDGPASCGQVHYLLAQHYLVTSVLAEYDASDIRYNIKDDELLCARHPLNVLSKTIGNRTYTNQIHKCFSNT